MVQVAILTVRAEAQAKVVEELIRRIPLSPASMHQVTALDARVAALEARTAHSQALALVVLMYGAAALGTAGLALLGGDRWRHLRRVVLLLSICNGALGVWINYGMLGPVGHMLFSWGDSAQALLRHGLLNRVS